MLIPVFLRKVTKYEANGKKRMHQLSFPCRHHLSRTCDTTRTQPPSHTHVPAHLGHHSRASTTPLAHNRPIAPTHPRHHTNVPAPTPLRTYDTTLAHLRLRRCAPAKPLSRICATTLTHLRPPSIHIGAPHCAPSSSLASFGAYQNQSEFIRAYPISSEKFRWVLIDSD